MEGKIIHFREDKGFGFILGDNGTEYFFHESDFIGTKKIHISNFVSFDTEGVEEDGHARAVHIRKIGHGKKHPFIRDLERIEEFINDWISDDNAEKKYRLQDIQMLKNYFSEIRDIEWCTDVRGTFRPKENK